MADDSVNIAKDKAPAPAAPEVDPELTDEERRNLATARRVLLDFWGKGMLEVADEAFAKDFVRHDANNPDLFGADGYKKMVTKYRSAFPDLSVEIDEMLARGNRISFRVTVRGTHLGEIVGIHPTRAKVTVTGQTTTLWRDGKVIEGWVNDDYLGMIRQLINAMPWWRLLLNAPALLKAGSFGRDPNTPWGEK